MKYLVDTSVLIHSLLARPKLSRQALNLLADESSTLLFSAISTWEIIIKTRTGKLSLPEPPSEFFVRVRRLMSLQALDITHTHALAVGELPALHRDPFDRMLIAQARAEGLIVLTDDRVFKQYDVAQIYCGT